MKGIIIKTWLVTLGTGAAVLLAGASNGANADGKALFTSNKCNTCHSVDGAGIAKSNANSKAPDLSAVGAGHNADWFGKYLNKTESLNGKQHMVKFKGSDTDLKTLAGWLAQQKKK